MGRQRGGQCSTSVLDVGCGIDVSNKMPCYLVLFLKTEEMVVNTANSLAKHGYLNDVVDRVIKSQRKKEAVVGRWLLVGGVVGVVAVAALRKVVG